MVLPPVYVRYQPDGLSEMRDTLIEALELGVRSYNCLKSVGINTIPELLRQTDESLLCIPNFGARCLEDVQQALGENGLALGTDLSSRAGEKWSDRDRPWAASLVLRVAGKIMEALSPREREIIAGIYGLDGSARKTLEEIGREQDVTRERIRQIAQAAEQKAARLIAVEEELDALSSVVASRRRQRSRMRVAV